MAYPIRIHLPDLIYHVLNRGNNRQVVFVEDKDYLRYLEILKRYKEKFQFKIFAYCLMTNHIHIILQTSDKASISKIMQSITIAHTRYYHYTYHSSGHVWQGRFRSNVIEGDQYIIGCLEYIHNNLVRANIATTAQDYPWSSFHLYNDLENTTIQDKIQLDKYGDSSIGTN